MPNKSAEKQKDIFYTFFDVALKKLTDSPSHFESFHINWVFLKPQFLTLAENIQHRTKDAMPCPLL